MTTHPTPDDDPGDSFKLAAGMATRWLAAHFAGDKEAGVIMGVLKANPTGLALSFAALAEIFLAHLAKAVRDYPDGPSVQAQLDGLALNAGASADAVVKRHRGDVAG
jgi:hypothetical protein